MKNGVLSKRVLRLEESATLALNARVKKMEASGQTVFNLTAGELDSSTPKYIQREVAEQLEQNKYTPNAGLKELQSLIAGYENDRLNIKTIEASNVVVTSGVKTGLYALFQTLLDPGDEVILPIPAWVSYAHMIELAGGKVVTVPLSEDFDLDSEAIAAKLSPKTKLIVVNSPHNPTGAVFSESALAELVKLLADKSVMVISDDIYETLTYDQACTSIAQVGLPMEQLLITNGFSKSQALTGWRVGYIIAPNKIAAALTNFLSHAIGNASLPAQLAAIAAFKNGNKPETLDVLAKRRKLVVHGLSKIPKLKFHSPGGAFYFFIDVRAITKNTAEWCEDLLTKTGVALVPGEAFFAPGFARLSFATDEHILEEGLKRLNQFIEEGNNA